MFYKKFTFLIVVRIILLLLNVIVLSIIFGDTRLFFNQIILFVILIIQIGELIRFVNHTNRELARLFLAIRHSDFSITFREPPLGQSFKALQHSMIEIIQAYKDVKIEKEAQYHFLQILVRQLQFGIISLENESTITIINPMAEQLAGIPGAKNWKLVRQLNPEFAERIDELGDNARSLMSFTVNGEKKTFAVDIRTPIILDKPYKLITFQDINSEIEQKEIEAWHKLIRILTHEIMNSVTPIASLTETMQTVLEDKEGKQKQVTEIKEETIKDIRFSLKTIHKCSEGLLSFVDTYRKLTKIPQPSLEPIVIKETLDEIIQLMQQHIHEIKLIKFAVEVAPPHLTVQADPKLMEQVIINLVTNSIQALNGKDTGQITLKGYEKDNRIIIEVADNGKGIPEKELSEIFVPFFSTKKEGSGIGLSLSKQIMSLHGGTIKVSSVVGQGTSFYLSFKKK
ncbi:MAG: ATP-binding protein [Cyclobacteriaceae bacterium]|nr:ATP-binding protein [Cyclobacteriaceae bacterium]